METKIELQKKLIEKLGKEHYINKIENNVIHFGIKLSADDFMDYVGTIKIEEFNFK